MATGKWAKDPRAESGMKRMGIEWTVERVRLCDIDIEQSLDKQARIDKKINEEWVLDYAQARLDGAEFPMVILQKIKQGRFFVWSGNHRVGTCSILNELELDAYVVKVHDQRMQDILPRVVNTWEGHRESRTNVLEHVKYVVERHGLRVEEVAKMFSLKPEQVWVALRQDTAEKRLQNVGFKATEFPKTTALRLNSISNDNAMKAAAKLLKDEKIVGDRANQIIDDVKRQSTEHQQMQEVLRWRKLVEVHKPQNGSTKTPVTRQNRSRLIDTLTRFNKFISGVKSATQLQLDDTDAKLAVKLWHEIETQMNKLMTKGG